MAQSNQHVESVMDGTCDWCNSPLKDGDTVVQVLTGKFGDLFDLQQYGGEAEKGIQTAEIREFHHTCFIKSILAAEACNQSTPKTTVTH